MKWIAATVLLLSLSVFVSTAFSAGPSSLANSRIYRAGSTALFQIPIHATDADIVGVTIRLPRGFQFRYLAPDQGEVQVFNWPDGTLVVALTDTIRKGESKTYAIQVALPEQGGSYSVDVVWVYYGGRSDLLADPNHIPALSCFLCSTPCRWGDSAKISVTVVNGEDYGVAR